MDLPIDDNGVHLIEQFVRDGRYTSATEVVEEGLRLLAHQEAKLAALREHVQTAIVEGGSFSDAEVEANVEVALDALERERFQP